MSNGGEAEPELSPAQRMEAFRRHMLIEESGLSLYLDSLPFTPDPFQVEALEDVALGESVLVCAPTGSGKTVVGEGAADLALRRGQRVFYTTPIKALSNQKLHDFQKRFGIDQVGLLTGDTTLNADAPIVVMTTEVLRNMIYVGTNLDSLGVVVLDEVHYLSDKFRGPVWEEVMIQLPPHVQLVALSATVSNSKEFGDWIRSIRGSCAVVTSTKRPVPLYQHMMVGSELFDLYAQPKRAAITGKLGPLSPDLMSALSSPFQTLAGPGRTGGKRPRRLGSGIRRASRTRIVSELKEDSLLPAIFFIFSRAGCDQAASELASAGLGLTSHQERLEIRAAADRALALVPAEDHGALGLASWARDLESGVAAHHAGLLPILKETIESLFSRGLLKVVFATETLALGINMPARTVVLESLEKWDGSEHVRLGPREYTQLTGRAGRRGIDVEGHAVVVESRNITPEEVSALASRHSYPLKSAFHPTYNMAVNLLAHSDMTRARQILESSFAQYQADAAVVELAQKLRRTEGQVEAARRDLHCDAGDAAEYFQLREDISQLQKQASSLAKEARRRGDFNAVAKLKVGDVVSYRRGRRHRLGVVIQAASGSFETPLATVLEEDAKLTKVGPREASEGIERVGHLHVPRNGVRKPKDRYQLARELRDQSTKFAPRGTKRRPQSSDRKAQRLLDQASRLEAQLRAHPVHACPQRDSHAVAGHRYVRLVREQNQIAKRIAGRTARIVTEFDQVCAVLRHLDFLADDRVTRLGQMLRRIYGERDVIIAQAMSAGIWKELDPAEFAAVISTVVYEPRADSPDGPISLPTARLQKAVQQTEDIYRGVQRAESKEGLELAVPPSSQIAEVTYLWARGASLAKVLERTEMSGGDFVRWMRQVIDMLDQIRRAKDSPLRDSAGAARNLLLRNVVSWTDQV